VYELEFLLLLFSFPVSSPCCLGNGDERGFDPVQKMDVLVRAVRNFCGSSTEISFTCPLLHPRWEPLLNKKVLLGTIKNIKKQPIDFSRVMVSLPVSGSLHGKVLSEVLYVHQVKAVLLSSCASLIVGVCFQLKKRQITVRTLSILRSVLKD